MARIAQLDPNSVFDTRLHWRFNDTSNDTSLLEAFIDQIDQGWPVFCSSQLRQVPGDVLDFGQVATTDFPKTDMISS